MVYNNNKKKIAGLIINQLWLPLLVALVYWQIGDLTRAILAFVTVLVGKYYIGVIRLAGVAKLVMKSAEKNSYEITETEFIKYTSTGSCKMPWSEVERIDFEAPHDGPLEFYVGARLGTFKVKSVTGVIIRIEPSVTQLKQLVQEIIKRANLHKTVDMNGYASWVRGKGDVTAEDLIVRPGKISPLWQYVLVFFLVCIALAAALYIAGNLHI